MKIIIRIEGWRQQDKKAIVKSIKGFVKSLAKRFGFQVEFDEINNDWIYRQIPSSPYLEKQLEAVEKALGFKLFGRKHLLQPGISDSTGRPRRKF